MTYQYEDCTFEKNEGIGIFTMQRPNRRNAWSIKMGEGFDHALEEMTSDPTSKVFIITGSDDGQAFTSGLDLKDFGPKEGEEEPNLYQRWQNALPSNRPRSAQLNPSPKLACSPPASSC